MIRINQYSCIHLDIFTTIWVKAGRSAPKELNRSWKTGTTLTIRIMVTTTATTMTVAGYFMAFLIFCLSNSLFSLYIATRSSMVSRAPDCSPDSTKEQKRLSKYWGYFFRAPAKVFPPSTSPLIPNTTSRMAGFSRPSATISKPCTNGTPAFIIVANWRVKIVISSVVTFFFINPSRIFLRFSRIFLMVTPCFRKVTLAKAMLRAGNSPLIFAPLRSTPS